MKNNWPLEKSGVNAVLITAHPDDETIFCGGTMLSYPEWNWQVICVTMQINTSRPQEYENAMSLYKSFGININFYKTLNKEDVIGRDLNDTEIQDWKNSIRQLNLFSDIIFTHNITGEYGHNHHISLNKITHELYSNIWDFVYPGDYNISPSPTKSKIKKVTLTEVILNKKNKVFNNCYTSQISNTWGLIPELMKYEFERGPEIFTSGDNNEI